MFDDYEIDYENLLAYELTDTIRLMFNEQEKVWYAENEDEEVEEDIIVLEVIEKNLLFEEEVDLWGYLLTKEEFNEIKELIFTN